MNLALQLPVLSMMTFFGMLHPLDMLRGIVLGAIFLVWCNIWTDVCIVLLIVNSPSIITSHIWQNLMPLALGGSSQFSSVSQLFAKYSTNANTMQNKRLELLNCPQSAKRIVALVSLNHGRQAKRTCRSSLCLLE
jgi:hypothetical protein